MAGQEGSNNNKGKASMPRYPYKRPAALTKAKLPVDLLMPGAVSLGPVHHKSKNLLVTEEYKRKIKEVLVRKNAGDFNSDDMKDALEKARALYEGKELDKMMNPDDFDEKMKHDFNEMMILDACFIIHAIDYITKGESEVLDEGPHLLPLILEDMFLLENQVPIIVLEAAMKVLGRKSPEDDIDRFVKNIAQSPESARTFSDLPWPFRFLVFLLLLIPITPAILLVLVVALPLSLILLVLCFSVGFVWGMCRVCCYAQPQGGNGHENQVDPEQRKTKDSHENKERELESGQEPSHNENQVDPKQQKKKESNLLGRLRAHLLSCSEENQQAAAATHDNTWLPPRRATELTDAGIKFHRSSTSSVKDVTFKKGTIYGSLYLPSLAQPTKTRLVNLMVYELCQGVRGHGITSYVSFLDGLIDCPEDVKELRSTQILPKALGDDQEVTRFFNNVGTFLAPFAYHDVLKGIETHCRSKWRPSIAKFCDKHFSSLWTTASFLIAILLSAITIATAYKSFFP